MQIKKNKIKYLHVLTVPSIQLKNSVTFFSIL